jgi:phage tail tape-measure protein
LANDLDGGMEDHGLDLLLAVAQLSVGELMLAAAVLSVLKQVVPGEREQAVLMAASVALNDVIHQAVQSGAATDAWIAERAREVTETLAERVDRVFRVRAGIEPPAGDVPFDESFWREQLGW